MQLQQIMLGEVKGVCLATCPFVVGTERSLVPRLHPARIWLPVKVSLVGKPSPRVILKAIRSGVGFGSGTETTQSVDSNGSILKAASLFERHLYKCRPAFVVLE